MMRHLCVVLHDVAPATWPQCERLLAMLDEIGATPVTLLIVPDFHGGGNFERDNGFIAAIENRIRRGDEVALHGYTHRDDAASPRTPWQWLRRRLLTASEGEFAALDRDEATRRITRGMQLMSQLKWTVEGFVPPAWLASAGARGAMATSGLRYTSTHTAIVDLKNGVRIDAPCVTASSRSMWRRAVSRLWMRGAVFVTRHRRLVRAGLHPIDADHADMLSAWRALLVDLLRDRVAVTKNVALARTSSAADAGGAGFDVTGKTPSEI